MAALTGIDQIASYLSSCPNTVKKYIKEFGLPVRRIGNSKSATMITTSELLDEWIKNLPESVDLLGEGEKNA